MHLREPTQGRPPPPHTHTHGPSTSCRIAQPSISTRHTWPGAVVCSLARAHAFIALLDRHTHTHTQRRALFTMYMRQVGWVRFESRNHLPYMCAFSVCSALAHRAYHTHTHTRGILPAQHMHRDISEGIIPMCDAINTLFINNSSPRLASPLARA